MYIYIMSRILCVQHLKYWRSVFTFVCYHQSSATIFCILKVTVRERTKYKTFTSFRSFAHRRNLLQQFGLRRVWRIFIPFPTKTFRVVVNNLSSGYWNRLTSFTGIRGRVPSSPCNIIAGNLRGQTLSPTRLELSVAIKMGDLVSLGPWE